MVTPDEGAGSPPRRIKVLEVLEATAGGTRKHLISLLRGLDREAFDVEVAGPPVRDGHELDTRFAEEVEELGVRLHPVAMRRAVKPFDDLKGVIQLARIMRRGRYDVVHLHSSKAGILGRVAAKLNRMKTVYTPNGFYFLNAESRLARSFYLVAERLAGLLTDRLVAVSESERDATIRTRTVAQRKIAVIPNAIESDGIRPDPEAGARIRAELGIAPGIKVLGTVSRFIDQKDPLTMIRALRAVLDREPDVRFIWAGEGGDREQETLALARELDVRGAIHFLGFRHDVQDVMNAFDVFVLSSTFEGLPYALLEAMFLEIPVVATDVVGSRDVVTDDETGVLVPPRHPAELAAGILRLLDDGERRRRLAVAAKARVEEHHSIEKMIARIEELYRGLAG